MLRADSRATAFEQSVRFDPKLEPTTQADALAVREGTLAQIAALSGTAAAVQVYGTNKAINAAYDLSFAHEIYLGDLAVLAAINAVTEATGITVPEDLKPKLEKDAAAVVKASSRFLFQVRLDLSIDCPAAMEQACLSVDIGS